MATIEMDIIKQRCDKLLAAEKLELIDYLRASLSPDERAQAEDRSLTQDDPSDEDLIPA